VAAEATDLHSLSGPSPVEHGSQKRDNLGSIIGDTEVRPVEVIVGPWWLPPVIEIEPVVRRLVTGVGVYGIERCGDDLDAVGQDDH